MGYISLLMVGDVLKICVTVFHLARTSLPLEWLLWVAYVQYCRILLSIFINLLNFVQTYFQFLISFFMDSKVNLLPKFCGSG
jgi:hypothetical protein